MLCGLLKRLYYSESLSLIGTVKNRFKAYQTLLMFQLFVIILFHKEMPNPLKFYIRNMRKAGYNRHVSMNIFI